MAAPPGAAVSVLNYTCEIVCLLYSTGMVCVWGGGGGGGEGGSSITQ